MTGGKGNKKSGNREWKGERTEFGKTRCASHGKTTQGYQRRWKNEARNKGRKGEGKKGEEERTKGMKNTIEKVEEKFAELGGGRDGKVESGGQPRRLKERTLPELTGQFGRARLVVLACEVGGRWSGETQAFLRQLAMFKARTEALPQQARAKAAWLLRWRTILACSGARALAQSLMEVRPSGRCDGPTPTHAEVVSEHRHVNMIG